MYVSVIVMHKMFSLLVGVEHFRVMTVTFFWNADKNTHTHTHTHTYMHRPHPLLFGETGVCCLCMVCRKLDMGWRHRQGKVVSI